MSLLLRVRGAWRVAATTTATHHGSAASAASLGSRRAAHSAAAALSAQQLLPLAPWHARRRDGHHATRAFSAAASAAVDAAAQRDALVEQLKPLCRSLYREHRGAQSWEPLVAAWEAQISALLAQHGDAAPAKHEVARTYEQGVAIALKQREFELARALSAQAKALGLASHDALYVFQIRAVPLQWVSRAAPLSLPELRALALGDNWESAVLELVRAEEQPHHRKSPAEREQFHAFVRDGVAHVLAAYERDVPRAEQRIEPYNAAVRAFAANGLPFAQLLRVLNRIPKDSSARRALNAETFLALLQGARWSDIPLTLERLVQSNVLRALQRSKKQAKREDSDAALRRSRTAALIWDQAMRAISNSYNDRFFDKRTPLDGRRIRELQSIFLDVEAQLLRVFPDKKFATVEDHTAVYEARVKTAALLGLPRQVHGLLNEYKVLVPVEFASGALGTSVFFKALEIFPSVALKPVNPHDVERARALPEVLEAPQVVEHTRAIQDLETNVIPAKKAVRESGKVPENDPKFKAAGRELRKAQQNVIKLKKRLQDSTTRVAVEVARQQRLRAADRAVEIVLERLAAAGKSEDESAAPTEDPRKDLDVAVAIMAQYMTAANRHAARMKPRKREVVASEIMRRVFELLDVAVDSDAPIAEDDAARAKVAQLFSLATKTAALFWREEDLERLTRRKKAALGASQLDPTDYDSLVFMRVAQLDIEGACALLQEMHYAGMSPTPTTIHRVVTGVLHKLYRSRGGNKKQRAQEHDEDDDLMDMDDSDNDEGDDDASHAVGASDVDDEDDAAASWTSGPSRLEDLPTFIQEWYNLYRVKPMAKTVVPVFARLLASNNVWEVKRLLQILDAMDGGLSPVTEFWLEKRLAAVGKSVDDLRVTPKHR